MIEPGVDIGDIKRCAYIIDEGEFLSITEMKFNENILIRSSLSSSYNFLLGIGYVFNFRTQHPALISLTRCRVQYNNLFIYI